MINSPVKGTITKPVEKISPVVIENNSDVHYDGKLMSFDYDSNYILAADESAVNEGDKQVLYGPPGDSRRIVMVATDSGAINYEDISGVKMRQLNTEIYDESEVVIDGVESLFFKKKEGFERLIVSLKDGKLLTFAMTANSNDDKMDGEFQKMVNSINWK